jgi:O-acetyl-ADP-ribose deacetylase (regulator of RNase III)
MKITAIQGDIVKLKVDAIVNAANTSLLGGGGVDGAIHRAAGPGLLKECEQLRGCKTGGAKITGGYKLSAKHVIHAVGPVWNGGNDSENELLASCYRTSLDLAEENQVTSLAFPAISTGIYSFPLVPASTIAVKTVRDWADNHPNSVVQEVIFCCFDRKTLQIYEELLGS